MDFLHCLKPYIVLSSTETKYMTFNNGVQTLNHEAHHPLRPPLFFKNILGDYKICWLTL